MPHRVLNTDLVVAGGGLAGLCAGIAAARSGAKVVLLQNRSVLGGNASSEIRMHIVGADCHGSRPGARETGLIEEFKLEDAARNPHRSYSQWDLLLYEKAIAEPNLTLMLDTECVGCEMNIAVNQRQITAVKAVRNVTEETFTIHAPFFADCSGDGRLAMEAGADFMTGREAKVDFGESLALDTADKHTLGASILFTSRRYDSPQSYSAPAWARRFQKHDFQYRPIKSFEYGYWWSEWGGQLDMIQDHAVLRHELLRIAQGIWDYIKNSGDHPESANWALDWVGMIPGKRESRRLLGPHVLTQQDVEDGRIFPDQVAYGGWWIDLHPPTGIDAIEEEPCRQIHFPHLYSIPLRCLYSRNVSNLFFAGRNLSATHVAFASTRVMGTCAVAGQAIGTAAALALGQEPKGIAEIYDQAAVGRLQQTLLKMDAFLPSLASYDSADRARLAAASASSSAATGPVGAVLDGVTRELFPHLGKWADGKSHRWESGTLPAWIELTWPTTQTLAEIHLTFDSGLQRELILSASDSTTSKTVRGPQPELVKDYDLLLDGQVVAAVRGNQVRKRIHRLPSSVAARTLRLVVHSTHGIGEARVFEIRAY